MTVASHRVDVLAVGACNSGVAHAASVNLGLAITIASRRVAIAPSPKKPGVTRATSVGLGRSVAIASCRIAVLTVWPHKPGVTRATSV
ncbi:MAG: hypothetical protein FWC28_08910 [Proteobacteria bacterium]|nr:hypothetical protein [Cystobacterineae bacterium]MCL2258402.1 hypothetical protein [Cystobacterineae bacterium]MCL2315345.1 hypothetical protein [Pseudomonadota bacterium]